jgi:hypothetical protein
VQVSTQNTLMRREVKMKGKDKRATEKGDRKGRPWYFPNVSIPQFACGYFLFG